MLCDLFFKYYFVCTQIRVFKRGVDLASEPSRRSPRHPDAAFPCAALPDRLGSVFTPLGCDRGNSAFKRKFLAIKIQFINHQWLAYIRITLYEIFIGIQSSIRHAPCSQSVYDLGWDMYVSTRRVFSILSYATRVQ